MHSNPLNKDKEPTYRHQNYLEIHNQQANAIHNLESDLRRLFIRNYTYDVIDLIGDFPKKFRRLRVVIPSPFMSSALSSMPSSGGGHTFHQGPTHHPQCHLHLK